jgi:AcrR family transcriptional regulator
MQTALENPTRERLLEAAFRVCSERGLHAATTREIADAAQVNEVTLFRHFGSKDKLIAAVFARVAAIQAELFEVSEPDVNDLQRDLTRYAQRYNDLLTANEALIRTLIGEARRHPEEARQVICEAARPMRERLIAYLQAAQKAGSVRREVNLAPAIDGFTGMLLAGMLRRTGLAQFFDYSADDYIATTVDIFLRGISVSGPTAERKRRNA